MPKFSTKLMPQLSLLNAGQIELIHKQTLNLLREVGVIFNNDEALQILAEAGCEVDSKKKLVKIPRGVVVAAVESAPEKFCLYDRDGELVTELGVDTPPLFAAGAYMPTRLSGEAVIKTSARDMEMLSRLTDCMPQYDFVTNALCVHDIAAEIADTYGVYLMLKNSRKPFLSDSQGIPGVNRMFKLLTALRGSEKAAREKPSNLLCVCTDPPLKWETNACQNIIDAARCGIPVEPHGCPIMGLASPVTLAGSLVQHTAEVLAGLVLAQAVRPGHPVLSGGYISTFNMASMEAISSATECCMLNASYAVMAKYYGLPCMTIFGSASKELDYQAGLEMLMGTMLAAQAGMNLIQGAGGINTLADFSFEKFILDAEMVAMVKRYLRGIAFTEQTLAGDVLAEVGPGGSFLRHPHTLSWYKQEHYYPNPLIDQFSRRGWEAAGKPDIKKRAEDRLQTEMSHPGTPLDSKRSAALDEVMDLIAGEAGVTLTPKPLDSSEDVNREWR